MALYGTKSKLLFRGTLEVKALVFAEEKTGMKTKIPRNKQDMIKPGKTEPNKGDKTVKP